MGRWDAAADPDKVKPDRGKDPNDDPVRAAGDRDKADNRVDSDQNGLTKTNKQVL